MKKHAFYLLFLLAFCASCTQNQVSITDTNFEEEAPISGSLTFNFSHALAPDSLLNTWLNNQYIRFEPAIDGKFKWVSKSELVFSPTHPLNPASEYTATLGDALLESYQGKKLSLSSKKISFHTPYLQLEGTKAYWAKVANQPAAGYAHFAVNFNYEVKPSEAAELLDVEINGQKKDFRLVTKGNNKQIDVYLPDYPIKDEAQNIKITLNKGLKVINGTAATVQAIEEEVQLPSPYAMEIEELTAEHDGNIGFVKVFTTQAVSPTDLKDFITIDPVVPFSVEVEPDGFLIESEKFAPNETYNIKIKEGVRGSIGGALKYEYEKSVTFGDLEPTIAFTSKKSMYLAAQGNKNVGIKITNIKKVKVSIVKIYENNLLQYLKQGYQSYGDDENYFFEYGSSPEEFGDVIFEKNYLTSELPQTGYSKLLKMDFSDKMNGYEGLYVVQVRSEDEQWRSATQMLSISDIGLISKVGKRTVTVFANSIATTKPMAGVALRFVGKNNQLIGTAKTDNEGVAVFELPQELPAGFMPQLITAKLGTDVNFLPFNNTQINNSGFDIGGKTENLSGFDAFLYGDRNIYRPGESINLACILRQNNGTTPESIPLILSLTAPDGSITTTLRKTTNAQGALEVNIPISNAASTGVYTAELASGNGVLIASTRIAIEEFLPDKIKVEATLDKTEYKPSDKLKVNIRATNLFGPPAANRNYEATLNIKRKNIDAKKYNDYNFNTSAENTYFEAKIVQGKTDEAGVASAEYEISSDYVDMGVLQADVFVTVFDETSRPVNRKMTANIYTQSAFFGIKNQDYYQSTSSPRRFGFVAINEQGQALKNVAATVKVVKKEFQTVLSKSDSYFRYESQKVEKVLLEKELIINETGTALNFTPPTSGEYEVRISRPGSRTYVSQEFWAYGYGSSSNAAFEVNTEGTIDIKLDKETYTAGEKATVVLSAPFAGKILVTIEGTKVEKHFYINTDGKAASFTLPIDASFAPNVYVSATLFRPHQRYDLPLTVAHGTTPLLVENPANKLPISIDAPKQIRSNTTPVINIKTEPNAPVTIAIVDEGILQLTNYKTPNPYDFFYAKRALEIQSYDIYPYLFPELLARSGRLSGDGLDGGKRINPLTNKRVKLIALWSGILQADNNGNISYPVTIPQFAGSLRVMAVAHKGKTYNSISANIQVADPIVISTPLPRFFSPSDTIQVPAMLTNTTNKAMETQAQMSTSGNVRIVGSNTQNVNIPPNSEKQVVFNLIAPASIGEAQVTISATANGEKFVQTTDITVRPTSALQKRSGSGVVEADKTANIVIDNADFLPNTLAQSILVSRSPIAQFAKDLSYLIQYPYGCVEQTVSSAFPQLYVQDLAQEFMQTKITKYNSAYHVQEAIKRLQLFQIYNGGLAYWSGNTTENWWGSVYAAHFLVEAKSAGYEVNKEFLDKLLGYIKNNLKQKKTFKYIYNNKESREISAEEIPYSLFVLALSGNKNISSLNFYKSHPELLSLEGKYLIAAAYALSGEKNKFQELLPKSFAGEKSVKQNAGSFGSPLRNEALSLYVLAETDPDNPQIGILSKHVSQSLKTLAYLNTHERAFALVALGKIAKRNANSSATATLRSGSKTIGNYDGKTALLLKNAAFQGTKFDLTAASGRIYYFYETEGISSTGRFLQEDSYLKVRRQFYDRFGQPITSNVFRQNDLIVVKISIQTQGAALVENVVISDLLPAGLEIENPRTTELPELTWIKDGNEPVHRDIRDDRINLFVTANNSAQSYYYVARAVSLGNFALAPISADAMYDGSYHSYHGAGRITVKQRN